MDEKPGVTFGCTTILIALAFSAVCWYLLWRLVVWII